VQLWPSFFLHAPVASHVFVPVQVSGSSVFFTDVQAPVPSAHVLHTPSQLMAQQCPSLHAFETHSMAMLQVPPFATKLKSSAVERTAFVSIDPPATRTLPVGSSVTLAPNRDALMLGRAAKVPVAGS